MQMLHKNKACLKGRAQALWLADQLGDDHLGVLFHRLAVDPDAEAEKVQEPLTLHRVPAQVGVAFAYQLRVASQAAPITTNTKRKKND